MFLYTQKLISLEKWRDETISTVLSNMFIKVKLPERNLKDLELS